MELFARDALWSYPEAVVVESAAGYAVDLVGTPVRVVPAGVLTAAKGDPEYCTPEPVQLVASLSDVVEHLRLAATLTDADAAEHVAEHVRRFAAPDLCRHGLPRFHRRRVADRTAEETRFGNCSVQMPVEVSRVVALVSAADRVLDAYQTLRARRHGWRPSSAELRDVFGWTAQSDSYARLVRAEFARDGSLTPGRARQVADLWLTTLLDEGSVRPAIASRRHLGPGLVLAADSMIGLYAIEFARLAGADPVTVERSCLACGLAVVGRGQYCATPKCQSERNRRKSASARDRRARIERKASS